MKYIRTTPQSEDTKLVFLGDVHYGAKGTNHKLYQEYKEYIMNTDNLKVILMGDMLETAQTNSIGAGAFEQNVQPQEQYEWLLSEMKDMQDKILLSHNGNHEKRIYKNSGIDIMKNVCASLHIPYASAGAITRLKIGKIGYNIYSIHGSGGSRSLPTKMTRHMKITNHITNAHITAMGHVHELHVWKTPRVSGDIENKKILYGEVTRVLTGHFLKYNETYAEEASMEPSRLGAAILQLSGTKRQITEIELGVDI